MDQSAGDHVQAKLLLKVEQIKPVVPAETVQEKLIREFRENRAKELIDAHRYGSLKMDCVGMFLNLIFLPCAVYAFIFFAAQRLDGENDLSFFTLLVPLWVCALPVFAYMILNGIAA